jgi:hypothetical protein
MLNNFKYYTVLGAGLVLSALAVSPAQAQQTPSSVDPGVVRRQFETPRAPRRGLEDIIEIPESEVRAGRGSTEKIFTLNRVVLEDSSVYVDEDLAFFSRGFVPSKNQGWCCALAGL